MSQNQKDNEQQFTIQPHPAKSNDPNDLARDAAGGANIFSTPGPHVLSDDIASKLEKPKTREELQAEAKKLN